MALVAQTDLLFFKSSRFVININMNSTTNPAWLEEETARRYHIFAQQTTMYQDLSRVIVEMADLKAGQRLLDLGCGTGVTTQIALEHIGPTGHIYALDISQPMLDIARQTVSQPNVTWLSTDAAHCAHLIDQPVDRIVCNSVFWQFRHKTNVMAELSQLLAVDGLLVFNLPEPYFIFHDIPRSRKVGILFKQLAAERYGVGLQDLRTLPIFLAQYGFTVVAHRELTRTRSAAENHLFLQIPVTTAWMEPPLDYPTRMALLAEAQQLAEPDRPAKRRWIYFVAKKARAA